MENATRCWVTTISNKALSVRSLLLNCHVLLKMSADFFPGGFYCYSTSAQGLQIVASHANTLRPSSRVLR